MPPYRNYIYEYHAKITSGEIIAGKWIKKIYEIIINGLQKQEYFFNAKAANKAIRFIENFCHHSKGRNDLIKLELWQKAIVSVIFGIQDAEKIRIFREIFIVIGRKNGKSLFASAIIAYMAYLEPEYGQEIYCLEGISGVTSVIYSTNSMGQHGDTYVGQRIEARDIDVVGHINTRDKAQALELRRRMLKIFNPELSATLVYEYGGFKRVIDCRAYGEPKILKKEVLYEFDLQIECLNPFWREEEETKEDIASWVAAWHFPCVIEKDSTKSMIYGYRAESVIVDCYNEGDVSTGMRIRFTALGTVSNPILLNVDTEEFIQINATMKTGDVIEINTKYGSKGAKLIRDGVETDYFRYIDVDSTFMQLAIGDNMFRYDAASGVNSLEVSIFYSKEFLGV